MKLTTYLTNIDQLQFLKSNGFDEVILESHMFSKLGKYSLDEVIVLASKISEAGMRPVFSWDTLMTESELKVAKDLFRKIAQKIKNFSAIRVKDIGVLSFIQTEFSFLPIQLILEHSNHNIIAASKWCELVGKQLERVVLSIELSRDVLRQFIQVLPVPVELLGLGGIHLFYSPRKLLGSYIPNDGIEIKATASSEETPHKGFTVIENSSGTNMFNHKDFCLLDDINELKQMGVMFLRTDYRLIDNDDLISISCGLINDFNLQAMDRMKELWPRQLIRGFYNINKSDVIFKKLKNEILFEKNESYLGDVVEANKKGHLGIMLRNPNLKITCSDSIKLVTPEGKTIVNRVKNLHNSTLDNIDEASCDQIVFIKYIKGVTVRTAVYQIKS